MNTKIKFLLIASIMAPATLTAQSAFADLDALHAMQRHCASLGRNVGVNPSGEYRCGSAMVKNPGTGNEGKGTMKVQPKSKKKPKK